MRTILIVAAAAGLGLSGCASTQRLASYADGDFSAEARIQVQGKPMNVSVHPRDNTLLAQTTVMDAVGSGLLKGATFGIFDGWRPDPWQVEAALKDFVRPLSCQISTPRHVGSEGVTFEAAYSCPADVDLRSLMQAQSAALMRGEPIHR